MAAKDLSESPVLPSAEELQRTLGNLNIGQIVQEMASNPDAVSKMMSESKSQLTPELMAKARQMASNGQGEKMMKDMESRGFDPKMMRQQLLKQQALAKGLRVGKVSGDTQKVIFITTTRQVRVREFISDKIREGAINLLGTDNVIEISCSRLKIGPLDNKTIKVWYSLNAGGKNKRASRVVGFPISSQVMIVAEDDDLTEADFLAAEALLQ